MRASFSKSIAPLEVSIGYTFRKKSLLKEAVTHKSFAHEKHKENILFNERMEFLGDAVLSIIISDYLYHAYPEYTESELSKVRAYTVQEATLAEAAGSLDIGSHLQLGKGEELTGGRRKPSLLANVFESVLGAIYLDGGLKKAKEFVLINLKHKADELITNNILFDFKTTFQELTQAEFGVLPKYSTHKEEGPEHSKIFEVNVFINDEMYGSGRGRSKKTAAQLAAKEGLNKIKGQTK
ncbi:MAG: ribonuclease III [Nitrospirae bacterium]|nr:ribonuclease III [Nitrospirota bacterium]